MVKLNTKKTIILGSKSPRRIELLKLMGFQFKLKKLDIDESYPQSLSPIQVALFLSKKKANHYLIKNNEILICADTIVYRDKTVFGKPSSNEDAQNMLQKLSNKQHIVVTGVTLKTNKQTVSFYDKSSVYFKKLSIKEIQYYIKNYNPLDKAGGYGIQDWIGLIGIKNISGSFYNVMGLPTHKLYHHLTKLING
jgi:septum formation protein